MKLLEVLAMIKFMLSKLNAGQRVPVPVGSYGDIQTTLIPLAKKIGTLDSPEVTMALRAIMEAVNTVEVPPGSIYLSDMVRDTLVEGITDLKTAIELVAFEYYKLNEFDATPTTIPLMQDVVKTAVLKGVI